MLRPPRQGSRSRGPSARGIADSARRVRSRPYSATSRAWECGGSPASPRGAWLSPDRRPHTAKRANGCLEVVHHQHDPLGLRVTLVHQLLDLVRPIHLRALLGYVHPTPARERLREHVHVRRPPPPSPARSSPPNAPP